MNCQDAEVWFTKTLGVLCTRAGNRSMGRWVMGQMGHENGMGHMGHGSLGDDQ